MALIPTGSQTIGPFFHEGLKALYRSDLAAGAGAGERLTVTGRIVDGDGQGVADALVEIWQANAAGKYDHPDDRQDKPLDPGFFGFGRIATAADGTFRFTTIKPGTVPGPGNALQAPHLNLGILMRGQLKRLATRVYFDGEAANANDPILALVDDPARRRTLIARPDGAGVWRFDVVLQGANETVFFDC